MAAKEKSALSKATEKARNARKAALAALDKADNAQNKKALEHAENELANAVDAERADRFKRVGGIRTGNAVKAIALLKALTNKNSYAYNDAQINKIITALSDGVKSVHEAFEAAKRIPEKGAKGPKKVAFEL